MKASYVEQLSRFLREDKHMSAATQPIKVMQVIARMNVGGPAVIVDELMIININQIKDIKFNKIIMSYQVMKPWGTATGYF